jgi:hypothetical protein
MGIYDTPAEVRDMKTLESMGFKVTNPNSDVIGNEFHAYKISHPCKYMHYFTDLVQKHDIIAFRALPDGRLPSGVAMEVKAGKDAGLIVIELPCGLATRTMGHAETVEYLENIGQR